MGSGKYDAWKDGRFNLEDIQHKTHSDVWGDSWTPAPLYELLGEKAPVGSYAGWVAGQETVTGVPRFTDRAQAKDWIENNVLEHLHTIKTEHMDLLSMNQLQDVAEVLDDMKNKHGIQFHRIWVHPEEESKAMGQVLAYVHRPPYFEDQTTYELNILYPGNDEQKQKIIDTTHQYGFTTEENFADTIRHEAGHLYLWKNPDVEEAAEALFNSQSERTWKELSVYASTNYQELFAESFSVAGRNKYADIVMKELFGK